MEWRSDYRLPKEILDAEIDRLVKMGIKFRLNYKVQDVLLEKQSGNFDAVFLGIGAQLIQQEAFKQDDSVYITDAFSFFKKM